ncbi:hypothetical protein Tco_1128388 [Tanacetum coccineum]
MASTSMKGSRVAVGHDYDGVVGVEGDDGGSRGGGGRRWDEKKTLRALRLISKKRKVPSYSRYTKVELARLLDEGCRRHYAVTSDDDDRITYTARELRAIAKERNVHATRFISSQSSLRYSDLIPLQINRVAWTFRSFAIARSSRAVYVILSSSSEVTA